MYTATFTPTDNTRSTGNHITLKDGTVLDFAGNSDAGDASSGAYDINTVPNGAPVVNAGHLNATENQAATYAGADVATDADNGDTLTITEATATAGGSVSLANGVVIFTPNAHLNGAGAGGFDRHLYRQVAGGIGVAERGHHDQQRQ